MGSRVCLDSRYMVGDLLEVKFSRPWLAGWATEVQAHQITVRLQGSGQLVTIEPGKRGKVRKPSGARLDQLVAVIAAAARARSQAQAQDPVLARTDGQPRPVPRPRPRYRDGAYLDFVRGWACLCCAMPGPSDAHHVGPRGVGQRADDYGAVPLCRECHRVVTDTGRLPGHDSVQQTEVAILRCSNALLIEWAAQPQLPDADRRYLEALDEAPPRPRRRGLAAVALLLLFLLPVLGCGGGGAALPIGWVGLLGLLLAIFSMGVILCIQAAEIQRLRRGAWEVADRLDAEAGPYRSAGDPRGLTTGRAAAAALRALLVLCLLAPRPSAAEKPKKEREKPKKEEREKPKKEEREKKPCKCKHVVWDLCLLLALLPSFAGCTPPSQDGMIAIGAGVLLCALWCGWPHE